MKLTVRADEAGGRLDQFVAAREQGLSRARVQQLIEQGRVTIAGRTGKASLRLRTGDVVELEVPPPEPVELVPQDLSLRPLYEDEHLLVLDKAPGIAVHPGAGVKTATLVHGLLHHVKDLQGIGGELRPGIVHRLDKDTSGCLVVAKSDAALRGLQAAFKARRVDKRYLALVHGVPAASGQFDTHYGRHPQDRKRFSSKVSEGRRAVTRYAVRGVAPAARVGGGGAALVDVELLTGRTHQIRAHFADAGHPLLHDALYGGVKREARLPAESALARAALVLGRQGLHAEALSFAHPITGATVACRAPLPADLRAALGLLGLG